MSVAVVVLFFLSLYTLTVSLETSLKTYDSQFDFLNTPINASNFKSYVAICAIVKNEPDIREWVEYHYKMGVGTFYIRDNGDVPIRSSIEDYIKKGIVQVEARNDAAPQLSVYHRCLRQKRWFHQFIAMIDIDEFIVTKDYCSIPSVLKRYEDFGGLTMNWMVFGSSGLVKRPTNGVLPNYYKCFQYEHVKSIVNTRWGVSHYGNPHVFHYSHGKFGVDTDFFKVETPLNLPRPSLYEILHLNHYHLKSKEDYDRNRKRGRASTTLPSPKNEQYFYDTDAKCNLNCSILQMPTTFAKDCPLDYFHNRPVSLE
jgi:hypothetical protein